MNRINSVVETIVALLVFLFLYTALSKYADQTTFKFSLHMSPILKGYSSIIAIAIPSIELIIVALLIIPKTRLWGLYSSVSLLSLFTIYLIGIILFSKNLPCGCGGIINQLSWKGHILLNTIFISFSIFGIMSQKKMIVTQKA